MLAHLLLVHAKIRAKPASAARFRTNLSFA